jgi:hypothetical protein
VVKLLHAVLGSVLTAMIVTARWTRQRTGDVVPSSSCHALARSEEDSPTCLCPGIAPVGHLEQHR